MSNVVNFTGVTRLDLDPDKVLNAAIGNMSEVVICGYDKEGNEYFASSKGDGAQVLWHLERVKLRLLTIDDERY